MHAPVRRVHAVATLGLLLVLAGASQGNSLVSDFSTSAAAPLAARVSRRGLLTIDNEQNPYSSGGEPNNTPPAPDGSSPPQGTGLSFPAWNGRMDTKSGLEYFAPYIVYSESPPADLRQVILDPTNASNAEPVLIVMYPQGSWAPSGHPPGGALFYAYPFGEGVPISYTEATLEYDVYLPPDFEFIKGGKLPGLGGGPRGCGGGVDPIDCWSVRVMWRREGAGEAYMYVPEGHQGADFCDQPPRTKCDYHAGVSLSRGAFYFQPGQWHHIALTVQMNDVGQANGVVEIRVNGERKIYYNQVAYRTKPGIQVDSVVFSTWYGGGDATWSPTEETFTLFKNIQLYRAGSPISEKASGVEGQAVEAAAAAQPVAVTLPLEDIEPQY